MKRIFLAVLMLWSTCTLAHRPSDAFLSLKVEQAEISGHLEIALRDIAAITDLDKDRNHLLTWGELQASQEQLLPILQNAVALKNDGESCPFQVTDLLLNDRSDARYAWFEIQATCPQALKQLSIDYTLLFARDPTHRAILSLKAGDVSQTGVFSPQSTAQTFNLQKPSRFRAFAAYTWEGMRHIWIGLDHVLFLLALLLPAVMIYRQRVWVAQPNLKPVLWNVFGVVTAFTLAHSITLSLAALRIVSVPGALVESLIAISVMVAALNNVRPRFPKARWGVAFVFGLIHGFGFATVLGELGLPRSASLPALLGFNVGVEIGQLVIVIIAVPLAFKIRKTRFYRVGILYGGSILVALIAAWWLAQRSGIVGG